ncbi:MAG: DUF4276 family protein [Stigonema ocellatum SAG 48.90 = DSM 106950]|nr:DUF4276 family protein [Stigonema ocellatum SAG 48.90 = DSM 106950]
MALWQIIICGSLNNAFRDFKNALKSHPDAFNVLLVDAEDSVKEQSPWRHLMSRDNWDSPGVDDIHCHLMVQAMEAWFIADLDALKSFYGQGFRENAISKNPNVETLDKDSLEPSLKTATSNTSKGEYQKIKHASKLLEILNVAKVRGASAWCDRFFQTVAQIMESS